MAWKVTLPSPNDGDKSLLLDDLSENDFVDATEGFPDVTWLRLYISPGSHPGAYYKLLCAVARKLQVPSPDAPKNIKESIALLKHIEQVDDDLPVAFAEGGIPLSSGVEDRATTTSSTSTGPGSGTPKGPAQRH